MLTARQIERFHTDGYLLVEDVIPPERYLDPVIAEYEGVLDNLADELHADGEIDSTYADLPFDKRVTRIYAETGRAQAQYFDFSLPFSNVTEQTPFWAGQAVLDALTAEPILDVAESLIGPEIYSNPVQHVRIKPPEQYLPKTNGKAVLAATEWHQDNGVSPRKRTRPTCSPSGSASPTRRWRWAASRWCPEAIGAVCCSTV